MLDFCAIFLQTPAPAAPNADILATVSALAPYIVPAMGMGVFQYLLNRRKALREQMLEDREYNKDYVARLLEDRQGQIDRLQAENESLESKCDGCEREREQLRIALARVESQLQTANASLMAIHRHYGDKISLSFFPDPTQIPPNHPPAP